MRVELLAYTPHADDVCGVAARTCVSKDIPPSGYHYGDWSTSENALKHALSSGHESVAEHAVFSFAISGVSRALTHQLVRHRLASYSQQSQRYVKMDGFEYVVPESIMDDPNAYEDYCDLMRCINDFYVTFCEEYYIPEEDARYILPNACTTNIVVSMNARELIHFCGLRRCTRAQWEIRELADEMAKLVQSVAPILGSYMVPKCERSGKCTERKSCGRINKVSE